MQAGCACKWEPASVTPLLRAAPGCSLTTQCLSAVLGYKVDPDTKRPVIKTCECGIG